MERVIGIGGIFFKAVDPDKLKDWYRDQLGVPVDESGYVIFESRSLDGTKAQTIWSPFPADTRHFAPSTAPFMLNYRVRDLHAMLAQLRAAGCTIDEKIDESEYGKFAWVMDPEGNRIELWEPPAEKPEGA